MKVSKVYIVMAICHGEVEGVEKVFDTRSKAEEFINNQPKRSCPHLFIEEHEIASLL